jgi:hypothetical protein
VTKLPFSPRCLTVARGWLCCGGENGNYTAINLNDNKTYSNSSLNLDVSMDPGARLPLDFDTARRSASRDNISTSRRPYSRPYPLVANVMKIGDEIVNCVTIWFPTAATSDRTYQSPVAIVANNDCTVFIMDLEKNSDTLEKLTFPDFVNRSLMSPDGELLITICDDPFMYVHVRKPISFLLQGKKGSAQGYEWVQWGRIQLTGQRQGDKDDMRGSFAASFSKSGKYLAVATQYGVISVFDTETLTQYGAEPLIIFTTSRPGERSGAVRAMEFSPEPFDLLAWTESSGRVGVADVRGQFLSRQLVKVDADAENVERIMVLELPGEPVIDPRLRSFRAESPSSNSSTPDYLGVDFGHRHLRSLTREMLDRHQSPLTPEELEVLQAHMIARSQRDAESLGSPSDSASSGQRPVAGGSNATNDRLSNMRGLPASLREFINPDRSVAASFMSYINDRNQDRERRLQQEPRRRTSIILAAAEHAIEREATGLGTTRYGNDPSASLEHLTLVPSRGNEPDSSNNPWAEIGALYHSRYGPDPPTDRSSPLRVEIEDDDRRDFAHRLRQPWRPLNDTMGPTGNDQTRILATDRNESLILRPSRDVRSPTPSTTGCCWSPNGRIL